MKNAVRFRRLLGGLLLWAIVPLPFIGIILPPYWIVAAAAGLYAVSGWRPLILKAASQNILAIAFVAAVFASGGWAVGPLRPLGQLLLLLAALRVVGVHDRKSFLGSLPAVGLAWVLSVTASTHVTLLVYLGISSVVLWWVGMRSFLLLLADEGAAKVQAGLPSLRHVLPAALITLLLAVPIFVLLPRLRSPWLSAGGGRSVTGFSSAVELSGMGRIQQSRRLAMIVAVVSGGAFRDPWVRFRATAFDLVKTGLWAPRRAHMEPLGAAGERVWLTHERPHPGALVELEIELLHPEGYLFLPAGTMAVQAPVAVDEDSVGGLLLRRRRVAPLTYRVWLRSGFDRPLGELSRKDLRLPRRDPKLRRLAKDVVHSADGPAARAAAIEGFLRDNFEYTLDLPASFSSDPIGEFLFSRRTGHCELFAGSMVLLLRSLGVPARMVGGYSGGTLSSGGDRLYVRQSNAHTWVEVWLAGRGWVSFDPTPAANVPGLDAGGGLGGLRWAYDRLQLFWDRYILTFGLSDQVEVLAGLASSFGRLLRARGVDLLLALLGAALAFVFLRRLGRNGLPRSRRSPAARALHGLERRLRRSGIAVPKSSTPRAVGALAVVRWPAVRQTILELVNLAEEELYANRRSGPGRRPRVRRVRREIRRARGRGAVPGGGLLGPGRRPR